MSSPQKNQVVPYLPKGGIEGTTEALEPKQQHYLLDEVAEKTEDLSYEANYEQTKFSLFIWCTLSGIVGAFLVMFAMGLTELFEV